MYTLDKFKPCAQINVNIMNSLFNFIKPGISTQQINDFCVSLFNGAKSAPLIEGFPKEVCISVNEEICHGIPSNYIIKKNDIVSVDCSLKYQDYFTDTCVTYVCGDTPKVVECAYESMWNAIKIIKPGIRVGDLGYIMEQTAKSYGFNVNYNFAGHGVGLKLHEDPIIPFYGKPNTGIILKENMCITVEPMISKKKKNIILSDNWTVVSTDRSLSAQFEHTIFITKTGFYVLTYNNYDKLNNKPQFN